MDLTSYVFLSTPSARRATQNRQYDEGDCEISIHALREEGDLRQALAVQHYYISIHALREEGDSTATAVTQPAPTFLSTPSARRATSAIRKRGPTTAYFYPRPPRGGRLQRVVDFVQLFQFLSTPSARRATVGIHGVSSTSPIFLSTPSARRATTKNQPFLPKKLFLSTPSARRATLLHLHGKELLHISIHALREEGDFRHRNSRTYKLHFYPRPPRGGRHLDSKM